jgi:hypothetical protein
MLFYYVLDFLLSCFVIDAVLYLCCPCNSRHVNKRRIQLPSITLSQYASQSSHKFYLAIFQTSARRGVVQTFALLRRCAALFGIFVTDVSGFKFDPWEWDREIVQKYWWPSNYVALHQTSAGPKFYIFLNQENRTKMVDQDPDTGFTCTYQYRSVQFAIIYLGTAVT